MRTSVFVGTSVDGFIARPNGAFDFLSAAEGEPHGYEEFIATVDAIVMGRNTYDTVLPFPKWPYREKPVFVLSSRALPPAPDGAVVERMSGEPANILSALSARGFEHIYVDGGVTIQRFFRAGLIARLVITRVPVLIGTGIPLFGAVDADILLTHIATRNLASGAVQSEYAINSFPAPRPKRSV
jgi:dihydrofolate reductase